MDIGADGTRLERLQQMLGLGLNDHLVAETRQRLVFGGRKPAFFSGTLFSFHQRVERGLPGAGGDAGIDARQICFGNLQIERGLAQSLIFGQHDLLGAVAILGLETGTFAGLSVHAVKSTPTFASVD